MLSARVARRGERDDDIRADRANQPHVVGGDLGAAPLFERLFDAERIPEVDGACEVLFRPVEAMQRRQLASPQDAERLEELGPDLVLAPVAARRGRQRSAVALTAIQHHQQPVVLIVGVRGSVHEDAGVRQMPEREPERDVPLRFVERDDAHLGDGEGDQRGKEEKGREDDVLHDGLIL